MTGPMTIEITEAQQIEEALHALLEVAVSDVGYAGNPLAPSRPTLAGEVLRTFLAATPAQRQAAEIITRPVGEAVRAAVRLLGKRLYEIGGTSLMQDVAERVADRDPSRYSLRIDVIDKRFDGIGGWAA